MEQKSDNIGITIVLIILFFILLSPWYIWLKEAQARTELLKEYNALKAEIKDINKLIDGIAELSARNEQLAQSENKYINLYCTSINFSTQECKNFIVETQKAIQKTETEKQKYLKKDPLELFADEK
jgi:ABC-type transport system involved in cytochrome bd biosynthesis fused ATPase/permease subunit